LTYRLKSRTALLFVIVLLVAACGGDTADDDQPQDPTTTQQEEPTTTEEETTTTEEETTTTAGAETTTTVEEPPVVDPPPESVVVIDGVEFTCAEITDWGGPCSEGIQAMFVLYSQNIDAYVNSGELGVISDVSYSYPDTAYAGFAACLLHVDGGTVEDYHALLSDDGAFDGLTVEDVTAAWQQAPVILCPGAGGTTSDTGDTPNTCVLEHGDLEGCFAYHEMSEFYDEGIVLVEEFLAAMYSNPPSPDFWYFVDEGVTGEEACTTVSRDGSTVRAMYTDLSYEYCPPERAIYVGQQMLWEFYVVSGDAGAIAGMAHEAGHHLQNLAGVTISSLEENIIQENQADCVAGAFIGWTEEAGYLNYEDDIADVDVLLEMIASAEEDPNRSHGTLEERAQSFVYGFQNGLAGCNEFFPDNPLIKFN